MLTGNKGEWSEIYTFIKLLGDGKIHAADSDLNKINDIYYPLIKILREEIDQSLEYHRNSRIRVIDGVSQVSLFEIPIIEFQEQTLLLFEKIRDASGRSFSISEVENFLKRIKVHTLKARSTDKSDIKIMVHDLNTGMKPTLGFSIKSKLGGASTLLNAGKTTNFIYEIVDFLIDEDVIQNVNNINTRSKIRDRIKYIEEHGGSLIFQGLNSEILKLNLQVVDSMLPEILSNMLLYYYGGQGTSIVELLELLKKNNPCNYNFEHQHDFYEYKIKNFLRDVALGMMPSTVWDGKFDATGGYIIVKEDGEIVCYHIYNHNEFQDYLLKNTRLETASSSRYEFGEVYKENDKLYIKLNLQIRFI